MIVLENVVHSALSCVFITIPEHIFFIIVTLRLMGRKEMLDLYSAKENLITILKIVIPSALTINVLEYLAKTPSSFNKSITLILLYSLLIYTLKQRKHIEYPKLYQKSLGYFFLSIMGSVAIESVTYPIVTKLVGMTFEEIKLNFYSLLISSLSTRIINIMILLYIFINKNNKFQINIGEEIFNNKFFMRSTVSIIIGLTIFEAYIIKLVIHNNLLNVVQTIYEQLLIIILFTFLIPASLITIVYLYTNYCIMINSEKQNVRNDI